MANDYDEFISRFGVRNIQVNRDYRNVNLYKHTASYYDHREETIDMELTRYGFEDLIRLNKKFDDWSRSAGEEAYLRRHNPAIAEAYDKYRMLLELYK